MLRVNLAAERAGTEAIHCYGGRLSESDRSALESLNHELRNALDVEDIEARGIRILCRSGKTREYRLIGGAFMRTANLCSAGSGRFILNSATAGAVFSRSAVRTADTSGPSDTRSGWNPRGSEITVRSGSEMPFHAPA